MAAPKNDLTNKIEEFLDYLSIDRGSSPLTLRNYRHYLNRFAEYSDLTSVEQISNDNVHDFRLYLSKFVDDHGKTLNRRTQSYHIISLRSFLKWLIKNDYNVIAPEKLDIPKTSERQVKFISGDQVDRLLSAPVLTSLSGKRDKAILEVLFSTGLRVSELTKLDIDKVDLERREFGIVGKGGRARVVFLSSRAATWLNQYLEARKDTSKALFIRHKGGKELEVADPSKLRLTPRSVQRMVKKYVKKIKLPVEVTPHILRHSFATDLLIAGADLRSVQEMLGHKNVATTQIYTHVTNKHLKDIHESFHAKGK